MRGYTKTMENNANIFAQNSKPTMQKKYNRKELRRMFGGKRSGLRSKAPREITSRKPLPMPENWEGWRNWKPKKKVV